MHDCLETEPCGEVGLSPVVMRSGPYRLYFYSHEPNEPPHIHVDRDDLSAKFWLEPVSLGTIWASTLANCGPFEEIVTENRQVLRKVWRDHFGT
jgi:Domain of unknown function (DUF4160)